MNGFVVVLLSISSDLLLSDKIFSSCKFCAVTGVYHSHGSGNLTWKRFGKRLYLVFEGVQLRQHLQPVQGVHGGHRKYLNFESSNLYFVIFKNINTIYFFSGG